MAHPLLARVQAWQEPTDPRPHHEWLAEQLAISEEIGGECTLEEVMAYLDDELQKAAKGRNHAHGSQPGML